MRKVKKQETQADTAPKQKEWVPLLSDYPDEYKQVIDRIGEYERRLSYERQQIGVLAKEYASDVAGLCAIAQACASNDLIPLRLCDECGYDDGGFLISDLRSDRHYVPGTLGIDLNYEVKSVNSMVLIPSIEYYANDNQSANVIPTGQVIYTWWNKDVPTNRQCVDMVYAMFSKLPGMKKALLGYVERQVSDVPSIDVLIGERRGDAGATVQDGDIEKNASM